MSGNIVGRERWPFGLPGEVFAVKRDRMSEAGIFLKDKMCIDSGGKGKIIGSFNISRHYTYVTRSPSRN